MIPALVVCALCAAFVALSYRAMRSPRCADRERPWSAWSSDHSDIGD